MRRRAMSTLAEWAESKKRKPLILSGARQVGKTWLLTEFGRQYFANTAYINLENNQHMSQAFEGPLDPERLIPILQAESGTRINPNTTLIILDEAQAVPRSIMSLKYFREKATDYAIAIAGSSLGIELHGTPFPVGKVSFLELHPLSLLEFLEALEMDRIVELIDTRDWDSLRPFHDQLIELTRMYMFVGGMPEAVLEFTESHDFQQVRQIQNELLASYKKDFSKYADNALSERLRLIWNSIPANLAQENKKFIFKRIKESARAREFEDGLQWLEDASLIHRVKRVNVPHTPLSSYQDDSIFKVYLHDVGLLGAMSNLSYSTVLDGDSMFREFKGALGEQLALQEMLSAGISVTSYYQNEKTKTELDFLIDGVDGVNGAIPVEVKYGTNLRAKSLKAYVNKYEPTRAIRTSASEYSVDGCIEDLPFYGLASALTPSRTKAMAELPAIARTRELERPGSSNRLSADILDLLEGSPLSRGELSILLKRRKNTDVVPNQLSKVLQKLKRRGIVAMKLQEGIRMWHVLQDRNIRIYRLIEGESTDTGIQAASRFEVLQALSDECPNVCKLDPTDFYFWNARDWQGLVDDYANPEDEEDEPFDLSAESGIPRIIEPWQRVVDVFSRTESFYQLIDVETSLEEINAILKRAFPDYGLSIVRDVSERDIPC